MNATSLPPGWSDALSALTAYAPLLLLAGVLLLGFLKASVVLALLRQMLGGVPPAPVTALLALMLSAFAMAPLGERVHAALSAPSPAGATVSPDEKLEAGLRPLRDFLQHHTPTRDVLSVADLSARMRPGLSVAPGTPPSLPAQLLAFALAELRAAFLLGFVLLLPFVLIDLLVGSLLSGLALSGLAVRSIALPAKLLLFVACDGWQLLSRGLLLAYGDAGTVGGTP